MIKLKILFILIFCQNCWVYPCLAQSTNTPCTDGKTKTALQRLRKDLFCSYEKADRPVKNTLTTTVVSMELHLRFFRVNEFLNAIEVHSSVAWRWTDEFLKWDKKAYEDINIIRVKTDNIWFPDVVLEEPSDVSSMDNQLKSSTCVAYFNGEISCYPPLIVNAHCTFNLRKWPYDSHNCSASFGSWSYLGKSLNLTVLRTGVSKYYFKPNHEWELQAVNAVRKVAFTDEDNGLKNDTNFYSVVRFDFLIKRHSQSQVAFVIAPAIVLAILTTTTFWLRKMYGSRMAICCTIICSCVLYLHYLGWSIPPNGTEVPLIVLFYRDILLLSCFSCLFALYTQYLSHLITPLPLWLDPVVTWIGTPTLSRVLLLEDTNPKPVLLGTVAETANEDETSLVPPSPSVEQKNWILLAIFIDRICFVFYLIYFSSSLFSIP